jgi:7-carboxy-7-deazaguanine synthase
VSSSTLRITEIFRSIQGESTWAGLPCVFVRLAGCSLRCAWCDTPRAFEEGSERTIDDVVSEVLAFPTPLVEITGGEPLEQEGFHPLAAALLEAGRTVLLETGGHVPLDRVDPRIVKIVDWKAPGSGMERSNRWENVRFLAPGDEVKIVVASRADFDWAERKVREHQIGGRVAAIVVSPAWGSVPLDQVAEWVRDSSAGFRLGIQIHKVVWGDKEGV